MIISDFFEDIDAIRSAMARARHRRHDLIACQVIDQQERDFDFSETAPFEGLEGEGRLKVDPRALRKDYMELFSRHCDAVQKTARSFGFDLMQTTTHSWLGPPLAAFLSRRNALMKRRRQR